MPGARKCTRRSPLPGDAPSGFLKRGIVAVGTKKRYEESHDNVQAVAKRRMLPFKTHDDHDEALDVYIHSAYLGGCDKALVRYALYKVALVYEYLTRLPSVLPNAKKALKGFVRRVPDIARDLVPYEALWLAVHELVLGDATFVELITAAVLLLCCDGYSRGGELALVRKDNIAFPCSRSKRSNFIIRSGR